MQKILCYIYIYIYIRGFHLSLHRARRFDQVQSHHPPDHPMKAGTLRTAIKETQWTMAYFNLEILHISRIGMKLGILCFFWGWVLSSITELFPNMVLVTKSDFLWDVVSCCVVDRYQLFGGHAASISVQSFYAGDGNGMSLRNILTI